MATGVICFGVVLLEAGAARRVVPTGTVRSKNMTSAPRSHPRRGGPALRLGLEWIFGLGGGTWEGPVGVADVLG